jgi:hypothetical protein
VAKAPSKTPVPSGSRPASRALPTQQVAAVVVPEGRQVLLKRLLVVALVVLALLVLLIVWLLLKRKGLV